MYFDIPFYANKEYIEFLKKNISSVYSVYYRLPINDHAIDARNAKSDDLFGVDEYLKLGDITRRIKKYGLLNTKIIMPELYTNEKIDEVNQIIA